MRKRKREWKRKGQEREREGNSREVEIKRVEKRRIERGKKRNGKRERRWKMGLENRKEKGTDSVCIFKQTNRKHDER